MRHFSKRDIEGLDRIPRINLINSITGIKPANLIGTQNDVGQTNLAIFSSVVHLGSSPAIIGCVSRPTQVGVERHTFSNIEKLGYYTINHVPSSHIENAHYTSAKFDKETSEFDACKFTLERYEGFKAPFVLESPIKLGMRFLEFVPIQVNGTVLIIGEIQHLFIKREVLSDDMHVDLEAGKVAGISGLNTYYSMKKLNTFPYARVSELPNF